MKNLRPIRFTPYLLFACMSLFFIGCVQKETLDLDPNDLEFVEEPAVQERETQLSVVDYKEIPQVMDELYLRLSDTGKSIKNGKLKYNNVDIDLKEIKRVLKNGGESSYSFALFVYDASPYHIYNLVMQNDGKGKLKEAYVVGFEMSPEDMESFFMNGEDYGGFRSTFRFYSVDSFFEDSKFNRVGKTGDCGTGTTGGNYSGDIGYNSPGTVLSHNYNGNNVTSSFSYNSIGTTYYYNSTIVSNGTVSTVSTEATSGVVEITTNGPTAPIYTTNVPSGTVQVNIFYEAPPSNSGPGATTEPCLNTKNVFNDGTFSGNPCPIPVGNQNKSRMTAYGDDCVSGSGTFAINTAAKPIHKLHYYLNGSFTAGHFNWFTDPDHTERVDIAKEFVWFLIDNGNTEENINFVLTAISVLMDGGSVDVDDKIISQLIGKAKCIFTNLISSTATPNEQSITHNFLTSFSSDMFNEKFVSINQKTSLKNPINGYNMSSNVKGITYFSGSNSYNIDILQSFVDEASDVEIALVMLHEMVHATLKVHQSHEGFTSFLDIFKDFSREEYGSELHHGIMAENYIQPIANALAQFDNNRENMEIYTLIANTGIPEVYRETGVTDSKITTAKQKLRNRTTSNCN